MAPVDETLAVHGVEGVTTTVRRSFDDVSGDEMARAMYASDTSYDGVFFTCVTSTNIFCFPSCPARKPRREKIRWARSREEAVAWGFRPCKRCRPDLKEGRRGYEADLMERVRRLVDESLDRIGIDTLAAALSLSPHHRMRLFRRSSVVSIHAYILHRRIAKARELLCTSEATVAEVPQHGA